MREQGVNGHIEMAYSFTAAGFEAIDLHMSDILTAKVKLKSLNQRQNNKIIKIIAKFR